MRRLLIVLLLLSCSCWAQDILRPTTETTTSVTPSSCGAGCTWQSGNLPNFWDAGGSSTTSSQTMTATSSLRIYKAAVMSGFGAPSGTYSSLTLTITWGCNSNMGGECAVSYSINGGSTYTVAAYRTNTSAPNVVTSITLSPSQDMTQLRVKWEACADSELGDGETSPFATIYGKDIQAQGTLAVSSGKKVQVISTE